jgi:FkbM family methyltransferase
MPKLKSRKKSKNILTAKNKNKNKKDYTFWGYKWDNIHPIYPKRPHLKLEELDKIPYIDENNNVINFLKYERAEQYVATDFVMPYLRILELGGRYGVVSSVINNKLEDPYMHVVVEPDNNVINALNTNKINHKCNFTIINGVVSTTPLIFKKNKLGEASKTFKEEEVDPVIINDSYNLNVKSYTLKNIMDMTNIEFNCLFVDCEGCLCNFLLENEEYVKNYLMIFYEADYTSYCDYKKVAKQLLSWGFYHLNDGFVNIWAKHNNTC